MGHIRLGNLPRSKRWDQVVALLDEGAETPQLAAAALQASQSGFQHAANDEALNYSVWLLTQLTSAARDPNYPELLRQTGLNVSDSPTLTEILGAFTQAVDKHYRDHGQRTDVGEMAQMAAAETISSLVGRETHTLFGSTATDVQDAFKKYSTVKNFGILAREFFSRFTRRYLTYFLSRELSKHVGGDKRFSNISEHSTFLKALETHCVEASEIVESFSGAWYSKAKFEEGKITPERTDKYLRFALTKLKKEFAKRGTA